MDWLTTLTTALGAAWLSGINLYATVATLGLLQHFGLARLPGDLAVLSHPWIIALALALYVIEFVADKIPRGGFGVGRRPHVRARPRRRGARLLGVRADFDPPVRVA